MTTETMDRAVDVFGTMFAKIADEHAATAARIGMRAINQIVESADIEAATALYRFRNRVSRAEYLALQVMVRKVIEARVAAWRAAGWKKPKEGAR